MIEQLQGPFTDSVFTDTITFAEFDGRTNAGDPIIGTKKTVRARLENKRELLIDADGTSVISHHAIATFVEIPLGSFVWVSEDTSQEKALRPVSVESARAPSGMVLYEIKL